ncbi:MAG: hypothetical protein V7L22_23125 [Nostoc sp.]|uniref:hypothetical protein n=1 Tax=Nostoc sp. TaxID=1180 RepID=UPI002FF8F7C0
MQTRFLHLWTYEPDSLQLGGHLLLWQSCSNITLLYQNGVLAPGAMPAATSETNALSNLRQCECRVSASSPP